MKVRASWLLCVFTVSFFQIVSAEAQQPRQTLAHHVRRAVTSGQAKRLRALPSDQRLTFSIVLPLRNEDQLNEQLKQLYDPSSAEYRHFLSVSEFTEQYGPSEQDYQSVVSFAESCGFEVGARAANRLVVPVTGTVSQIQQAFNVQLNVYQHPVENRTFFSPYTEPNIPSSVPIEYIAGLDNFSIPQPLSIKGPSPKSLVTASVAGSGPSGSYLGSDMRAVYYGGSTLTGAGQTVGLFQFDGYFQSDVDLTFSSVGQAYSVPIVNVLLDGVDGTPAATGDDTEQVVDIVQAIGMAPGLSQVRVYIGNIDVDILNAIAAENLAKQVSISWSWQPTNPTVDDQFFKEFAAQGQSVFAASGDYGAFDPSKPQYFPAEDDWVTATGGTVLQTQGVAGPWESETAWHRSGGGISPGRIALPSWQSGLSNASNGASQVFRNVPDVAMEANTDNYACDMGACSSAWGGTSLAAPRWAGFMALVNEQAATAGDSQPGFLNPTLYAIGENSGNALHDITSGNNQYVQGQATWFNAVPGYDLVTGWGSPAGQALIDQLAPWSGAAFQLSLSTTSLIVNPGASGNLTVTVGGHLGFSGSVNLAVNGLPDGVTASWSQNPTAGSSTLTLNVGSDAPRGQYRLTVAGTCGNLTSSTPFTLLVNAAGFSITALPMNFAVFPGNPGVSGSATFTVNEFGGFAGPVSFALGSDLPPSLSATWTTNSAGIAMLTLTASPSAQKSVVDVTIIATSGNLSASTEIEVYIYAPMFEINVMPPPATLVQGSSVTATVSAIPLGDYEGAIVLSAPQLPSGVTASFAPASISTTQSGQVTLTANPTATLGVGQAMIVGTGPGDGAFYAVPVNVVATQAPGFTISAATPSLVVQQGSKTSTTLTVNPVDGFSGPVTLSGGDFPGVVSSFSNSPTIGSSTWTVSVSNSVPAGSYWLQYSGSSGNLTATGVVVLIVGPAASFTIGVTPDPISIAAGGSASATVTVTLGSGFSGAVDLAVAPNLPAGITATIASGSTATTNALQISAAASVPSGQYCINLTGVSGTQTLVTTVRINVTAPPAASPTFSPPPGAYASAQPVSISDSTPGAMIYYTTDGSAPTINSTVYSKPITVSSTQTIQAIATASGYASSAVASAAYTINTPTSPVSVIGNISPGFTSAGGAAFTLTLTGSGFATSSTAYWGTSALATQYASATRLTAQVTAADIASAGATAITVQTPSPGGGTSNSFEFEVDSTGSGTTAPTITSTAAIVAAGSTANYPVTLPAEVTSATVTCLNLPTGAECSYSSTTNTVTITTSSTTPAGTYQVTVVFAETVSGAATAGILLPFLLLPLMLMRKRLAMRGIWTTACFGLVLTAAAAFVTGCGGKGSAPTTPPPTSETHQVTSSGSVSLTIQ